jgi:hypothetical protein
LAFVTKALFIVSFSPLMQVSAEHRSPSLGSHVFSFPGPPPRRATGRSRALEQLRVFRKEDYADIGAFALGKFLKGLLRVSTDLGPLVLDAAIYVRGGRFR